VEPKRVDEETLASQVAGAPPQLRRLALRLRELILATTPGVDEAVKFRALSYFKSDHLYGAIGGNVCMIDLRENHVRLKFLHGASLPDPDRLLQGKAKALRYIEFRPFDECNRSSIRALILAAAAHTPAQ
jgi:hypothetical protein